MKQMAVKVKNLICKYVICILSLFILIAFPSKVSALPIKPSGDGTSDNPYAISSRSELEWVASEVDRGQTFTGCLLIQTKDIDLNGEPWKAIGGAVDGAAFEGTYNGCGNSIRNLVIEGDDAALFHTVSGRIINLSIDGGRVEGRGSAVVAVRSEGRDAVIANCVSSVEVSGSGSSGIVVDFPRGTIANCVFTGSATGENSYGIIANPSDVKLHRTYSSAETWVCPDGIVSTNSFILPKNELEQESIAIKLSISSALCNYLFLGSCDQGLLEWRIDSSGKLILFDAGIVTYAVSVISEWLMTIIAGSVLMCRLANMIKLRKLKHLRTEIQSSIISTVVEFAIVGFCDAYCITQGIDGVKLGPLLFVFIMHLNLGLSLIALLRSRQPLQIRVDYPLTLVLILMMIVEVMQFGNVPRYDANIYYGSFTEACRVFDLNLISFIGSFNCWKWAQGVAIFCAPFEFLFPGDIIGIYVGNLIVSAITIMLFNSVLKQLYKNIGDVEAAIYCALMIFSPYIIGLFSYFDMDWNVACYAIWLIYALMKKDDLGVAVAGFLLALTKVTGIVFYCILLMVAIIMEVSRGGSGGLQFLKKYLGPKRLCLWMMPAFMYLGLLIFGDDLTTQAFFGTYVSKEGMIDWFDVNQIANTLLHSFVFCFRWLIIIMLLMALLISLKRRNAPEIVSLKSISILKSIPIATALTVMVLCIYNSDANCPRYTTFLSPIYALLMPFALKTIIPHRWERRALYALLALMIVQSVITIDPAIIQYCSKLETGSHPLYKLAYRNDKRPGMNLISGPNGSTNMLGDLYTYNLQYSYYDDLLEKALKVIKPNQNTTVYSYNLGTYEMNLSGRGYGSYNIYYDPTSGKRNFNDGGENILISFKELDLTGVDNESTVEEKGLPRSFWVLIPYRLDLKSAIVNISELGYRVESEMKLSNFFGSLALLKVSKNE